MNELGKMLGYVAIVATSTVICSWASTEIEKQKQQMIRERHEQYEKRLIAK